MGVTVCFRLYLFFSAPPAACTDKPSSQNKYPSCLEVIDAWSSIVTISHKMLNNSSTLSAPPIHSKLDYAKDCHNAVRFVIRGMGQLRQVSACYTCPRKARGETPELVFPYAELITLLRSISPVPFSNMSSGAIVDWANQDLRYFFHGASLAATDQCHDELCKEVPWEGNPDVAGIGVCKPLDTYVQLEKLRRL